MISNQFIQLCEDTAAYDLTQNIILNDEQLSIEVAWEVVTLTYNRADEYELSFIALANAAAIAISTRTGHTITEIAISMQDLHRRKNAGYSGNHSDPWKNFRHSKVFGVTPYIGCLVRMGDKYQRYLNLRKDSTLDQVGESIIDTLMDLACYALIAVCLREEYVKDIPRQTAVFGEF
jgi:hypothetical protein